MYIPIFYRIKYKSYPGAPKATGLSKALGTMMVWPMKAIVAFFWFALWFYVLEPLAGEGVAMFISIISLVPFFLILRLIRKALEKKIDEKAMKEAAGIK